jgi:hypothetical protein
MTKLEKNGLKLAKLIVEKSQFGKIGLGNQLAPTTRSKAWPERSCKNMKKNRLTKAIEALTAAACKPTGAQDTQVPKGWVTIQEMQKHYGHRWRHTTSSRASSMSARGLLARKLITRRSEAMHYREYIYRILPPAKSLADADLLYADAGTEKVPKGWVPAKQIALALKVSVQAVWQMAERHNMPTRFYRVRRGLSGVIATRHFQIGPMLRLHDKR